METKQRKQAKKERECQSSWLIWTKVIGRLKIDDHRQKRRLKKKREKKNRKSHQPRLWYWSQVVRQQRYVLLKELREYSRLWSQSQEQQIKPRILQTTIQHSVHLRETSWICDLQWSKGFDFCSNSPEFRQTRAETVIDQINKPMFWTISLLLLLYYYIAEKKVKKMNKNRNRLETREINDLQTEASRDRTITIDWLLLSFRTSWKEVVWSFESPQILALYRRWCRCDNGLWCSFGQSWCDVQRSRNKVSHRCGFGYSSETVQNRRKRHRSWDGLYWSSFGRRTRTASTADQ